MRATQAPEQWRKLHDAVVNGDYESANKICVTYDFNKDERTTYKTQMRSYVAKSPEGEITHHESVMALARSLEFSESHLRTVVRESGKGVPFTKGGLAGWEFWEKEYEEGY